MHVRVVLHNLTVMFFLNSSFTLVQFMLFSQWFDFFSHRKKAKGIPSEPKCAISNLVKMFSLFWPHVSGEATKVNRVMTMLCSGGLENMENLH